jgi:hypothetical protein
MDISKVAEELNWEEGKTLTFYNALFFLILDSTRDPSLQTIHLQGFGKFYVKKILIDKVILAYIKQLRTGNGDPEDLRDKIRSLWEARKGKSYKRI